VSEGSGGGGIFRDTDSEAEAWLGSSGWGIQGYGTSGGGIFADTSNTGHAYVANGDYGIRGYGSHGGGYFMDSDSTGYAYVGYGDYGISARGSYVGGYFRDTDNSTYAYVGFSTYKITGSGTVSFVQNHPLDPSSVIVYAAPEGDEVATYTRGTARLENGEAKVALGETFQWVTNPDIGLTAFLTPVNDWCDLYVAGQGTDSIVVRSRDGSDCTFNFIVYGLRIGFEESTIVQEKRQESYIPSMAEHRELAARRPELARHTALARWAGQAKALGDEEALDLSRAHALRDLIGEYDPALHGPVGEPLGLHGGNGADRVETAGAVLPPAPPEAARAVPGPLADREDGRPALAALPSRDVYARSFRPSAGDLASLLEVSEAVGPGDVLVVDPERPSTLRRGVSAADPTVVGVVAAEPGVVLGSGEEDEGARAAVTFSGIAACKVDATFGPVYPGDLLVTSPNPGHAMRADLASPGTVLGKALQELTDGAATIRILVMPR
jgi:hypothetical protein